MNDKFFQKLFHPNIHELLVHFLFEYFFKTNLQEIEKDQT